MLKFLGKGGAFDIEYGNNSAFEIIDNKLYLFDCGYDVFKKLIKYKLLENLKEVNVLITHLHGDHIGSLSTLISYLYAKYKNVDFATNIVYPDREKLAQFLYFMGVSENKYYAYTPENIAFKCESIVQEHIDGSFGYFVEINDKNIFYSGDTAIPNPDSLIRLNEGRVDYFYHEAMVEPVGAHSSLYDLQLKVNPKYSDRVFIMHTNYETEKECVKFGFNIIELYKGR